MLGNLVTEAETEALAWLREESCWLNKTELMDGHQKADWIDILGSGAWYDSGLWTGIGHITSRFFGGANPSVFHTNYRHELTGLKLVGTESRTPETGRLCAWWANGVGVAGGRKVWTARNEWGVSSHWSSHARVHDLAKAG